MKKQKKTEAEEAEELIDAIMKELGNIAKNYASIGDKEKYKKAMTLRKNIEKL